MVADTAYGAIDRARRRRSPPAEHDQRRNGDEDHVSEQQVELGVELADEIEERQLRSDVLVTWQKVERSGKVIVDSHRLDNDDRHDGRP
jgi:hypothetical protein